jgi:hypothetical protein
MSKHAIALILFLSPAALGQDNDNYSTDLMNLNYYPHYQVVKLNPHITTTYHNRTTNSNGGDTTTITNQVFAGVEYGVASRLRVVLNETLLWDQNNNAIGAAGAQTETTSAGLSDPTVGIAWRYLEDARNGFSGDLTLAVTPSFGPKITGDGSVSKTGNNLEGFWSSELSTAFYWRFRNSETSLSVTETRNFSGGVEGSTDALSFRTEPYWQTTIALAERIHFTRWFFVQASVSESLGLQIHEDVMNGNMREVTQDPPVTTELEFGFRPAKDLVLVVATTYRTASSSTLIDKTSTENSNKSTVINGVFTLLRQF